MNTINNEIRKRFTFGKVDYNRSGRKNCAVEVEISLRHNHNSFYDKDYEEFTAMGFIYNPRHTDCYAGGQCLDTINKFIPKNSIFKKIYKIWKKYHLNGMHAGTPEQEQAIKEYRERTGKAYDYTDICNYLKSIYLYEVIENGQPYKYGHGWLCREIPEEVKAEIKELLDMPCECVG